MIVIQGILFYQRSFFHSNARKRYYANFFKDFVLPSLRSGQCLRKYRQNLLFISALKCPSFGKYRKLKMLFLKKKILKLSLLLGKNTLIK